MSFFFGVGVGEDVIVFGLAVGIKYTVVFLILVFYTSFSLCFGLLEGLFRVFLYSTTSPLADPVWWN